MSTPMQRLMQMLPQLAQIRNQREGLAQDRERLDMNKNTAQLQERLIRANSVLDFVQKSGDIPEQARDIVAKNYADLAGIVPAEQLAAMMGGMPESTRLTTDRKVAGEYKLFEKVRPRIEEALGQIPDPVIRDQAFGYISKAFSGTDAGSARVASATADRETVGDPQIKQAVMQQLKLVMSPQELKEFEQRGEQLRQGWTSLTDNRNFHAMDHALSLQELTFRKRVSEGTVGSDISPAKSIENIMGIMRMLNDKTQSETGMKLAGVGLRPNLLSLYNNAIAGNDMVLAAQIKELLDADITKVGPASLGGSLRKFMGGYGSAPVGGPPTVPLGGAGKQP